MDLSRVDLNLLVLFEAVMEERHVGRAAQRMNLSPSAISHGLGRLRRLFADPLFLRTPRGVVPSAKADELRAPIAEALRQLRMILVAPQDFDPLTSDRRFVLGAPDAVSAVVMPRLLARLKDTAPRIRVSLRDQLPEQGEPLPERAWQPSFHALDDRAIDVGILPVEQIPGRFQATPLYRDDFIVAMRKDHAFARHLTLARYCSSNHLLVSETGDATGFVDAVLERQGRVRSVTVTVPGFILGMSILSESDLVAAMPRELISLHGARFGVIGVKPPIALGTFKLRAVTPKGAMTDAGVNWLVRQLEGAMGC